MAKIRRAVSDSELWQHYVEQLPMIAALVWDDGTAQDAASHGRELIEACFEEAQDMEEP